MFTNERLFTIQAFTITRVHCNNSFLSKKNIWDENPTPEIGNLPTFSDAFLAVSAGPTAFFVLKSNFIFLILVRTL